MGSNERGAAVGGTAADGDGDPESDWSDESATDLVVPDDIRAQGRPAAPPEEPGDERTHLMDPGRLATAAQANADPVVEVGPIVGYEQDDPAGETLESIAVDIQRPALPFDAPLATLSDDPPMQPQVRAPGGGTIEDPQTASGLISAPAEHPLPFAGGSGGAFGEPAEPEPAEPQSLWSRNRQHSSVDPAELPSSLAPSALSRSAATEADPGSRPAWLVGALIAVAAGLVLALALAL